MQRYQVWKFHQQIISLWALLPFVAVGCGDVKLREGGCLADIAPTMLPYIGLPVPAEMTGKSIIVE